MSGEPSEINLRLCEGPFSIVRTGAPHPHDLYEHLRPSQTPAILFDFDSALITHANGAAERMLGMGASHLIGQTGRAIMPPASAPLVEVISASLRQESRYSGLIALRHGRHPFISQQIQMSVVSNSTCRYGINTYMPVPMQRKGPPTLLVVDDEPSTLRALARLCGLWGTVRTASCGLEAVRILAQDPDITGVLCDQNMPDITGLAVLEALRVFRPDLVDRFVLHSGRSRPVGITVPFLPKPASLAELRSCVSTLVSA